MLQPYIGYLKQTTKKPCNLMCVVLFYGRKLKVAESQLNLLTLVLVSVKCTFLYKTSGDSAS